jgi:peptide/nickel transport system permease protein
VIAAGVGLFLAAVFGGMWVLAGLELLGLGARPPAPTLGGLLSEALQFAARQPVALLAPIGVLWLSALGLYAAAVALMERVRGRAAAGWFNA